MNKSQSSFHNAKRSLNAHEHISYSQMRSSQSNFGKKNHKFILEHDVSNKYKYSPVVQRTIEMPNSIPFLRDVRDTSNQKFSKGHFKTN